MMLLMGICICALPTCACLPARLFWAKDAGLRLPKVALTGRIHHCMRAIGQAEKALEMMCKRGFAREAFGKKIIELGANYDIIANARMEIEMARLLCLKAAYMMDTAGVRAAQPWISKIKVVAPLMAGKVIDEAMQLHGAAGIYRIRIWPICGPMCAPCGLPTAPTPSTAVKSRGQS